MGCDGMGWELEGGGGLAMDGVKMAVAVARDGEGGGGNHTKSPKCW